MVKSKQCQVRVHEDVYVNFREYCRLKRMIMSGLVSLLLEDFLIEKGFINKEKSTELRILKKGDDSNGVKIPEKNLE